MNNKLASSPYQSTLIRVGETVLFVLALEMLWRACGIVTTSERVHLSLPFLWLFVWWRLPREERASVLVKRYAAAGIVMVGGIYAWSWMILAEQARSIYGSIDWREPIWKTLFICSIFAAYWFWSRSLTLLLQLIPGARNLLQSPRGWWLRTGRMSVAIILFAPFLWTTFHIHRSKIANRETPLSYVKLPFRDVSFQATDGLWLHGWFIEAPKATKKTVIVSHGVGANSANFLGVAPFLHGAGYNVLFFDFRGHGNSAGHSTTFGSHEARDVIGAVRWLRESQQQTKVALYGFSMGGSAVINAMENSKETDIVRAVIVDSTFSQMWPLARSQTLFLPQWAQNLMLSQVNFWAQVETGVALKHIAPMRHVAKISPRPLLIIHGASDDFVPPRHAQENFAAARHPKILWTVPNAGHCLNRLVNPAVYEKRVIHFLRDALR